MRNIEFTLSTGWDTITAKPLYSDDIALVTERETNQIFFREKLSGKLTFLKDDYTWIMNTAFSQKITCNITITDGTDTKVWSGYFYRTDCTINEVDGILTVEPVPNDKYSAILDAMDNEVDLYENGVVMNVSGKQGAIRVPPILQIYRRESDVITNYCQGRTWELDVSEASNDASALADIGFSGRTVSRSAKQTGNYNIIYETTTFYNENMDEGWNFELIKDSYKLKVHRPTLPFYKAEFYINDSLIASGNYYGAGDDVELFSGDTSIGYVNVSEVIFYSRILNSNISLSTGWKNVGNFATPSKWYTYARATDYQTLGILGYWYNGRSSTPTKYGMIGNTGYYYKKPTYNGYVPVPTFQQYWTEDFSFWILINKQNDTELDEEYYWKQWNIPVMTIGNIIRCLLSANNINNVSFQETTTYSQFLYDNPQPITSYNDGGILLFTPKSNITNGKVSNFATKAPCKLGTILDFLKKALNVYWYIDDSNRLIIEHWNYFRQGKTYSGNIATAYDLTDMYNVRNEKPWAFGQNEYKFEKYTIPQFLKWSWMDETDYFFDGTGIKCLDEFVTIGQTEESSISDITTNIDFLIIQPDKCSQDGFVAMYAVLNGDNNLYLPTIGYSETEESNEDYYYTQNSQLAMFELQKSVLQYNLPCSQINRSKLTVTIPQELVKRAKTNEVKFPAFNLDPFEHVTTNIGDGEVESIENKICNNMLKVKLKYETE